MPMNTATKDFSHESTFIRMIELRSPDASFHHTGADSQLKALPQMLRAKMHRAEPTTPWVITQSRSLRTAGSRREGLRGPVRPGSRSR